MFFLKAAYCRIFQGAFRLALPLLPYREPEIIPSCGEIAAILHKEGKRMPLIVTDEGIVKAGLVNILVGALTAQGVKTKIYSGTLPNPTVRNIEDALSVYKGNGCDCLIAIGGGSAIDCAKAVGARLAYPKRSVNRLGGMLKVLKRIPTLIAIPTTAGTGSETTLAALITDSETHHKYAIMSFPLIPRYAVLDPALTRSLPANLTAATGMDALTHAVEAYIGRSTTARTRELALDAVNLIFENIEKAYSCPDDLEARRNMLNASYMAGAAFTKSYVGYIHAVAHSLGGRYATPHGLANAVIMPHVLKIYGISVHKKLYELACAAGICSSQSSHSDAAEKFIAAIEGLNERMGIPQTISGIDRRDIPHLAHYAQKEANPLYPVPQLMTKRELERIYYRIMG